MMTFGQFIEAEAGCLGKRVAGGLSVPAIKVMDAMPGVSTVDAAKADGRLGHEVAVLALHYDRLVTGVKAYIEKTFMPFWDDTIPVVNRKGQKHGQKKRTFLCGGE